MENGSRRIEVIGPAAFAAAAFLVHVACWDRYGIFRDELYFIVCGERLAWGYVDQPPGIAAVAGFAHALFDTRVPGLRLLAWLASAALVFFTGRLASRLGGRGFAATAASCAVFASPLLLGLGHYLTMNAFEPLALLLFALVVLRIVDGADRRLWLAAGVLAAVAVLFKYTAALVLLAIIAGIAATPARRALFTPWALAGAALAGLLVLPNLLWQAQHGFPFIELVRNGQLSKNAPFSLGGFATALLTEPNPLNAPLWLGGLAWLLATRRARFVGIGAAAYLILLLLTRGKPYYAAPALPLLLAAGGVALERVLRPAWARASVTTALAVSGLALAPLILPLLPAQTFVAYQRAIGIGPSSLERKEYGALPQHFADQHGWPELAEAVRAVYLGLDERERARAAVFGQNYGEAAALDVYSERLGLPPAVSGHNNYFLWGVPQGRGDPLIVLSDEEEDCAQGLYRERVLAARVPPNPLVMPYEDQLHIWICRGLQGPLGGAWARVRHYE